MRTILLSLVTVFSFSSFAAETPAPKPAAQPQQVQLTCVARILNMAGSKASYEQIPMKKIVEGRYVGTVDDAVLSIDIGDAPIVVLSLQLSARRAIDVQGIIEPTTGLGPELTYTLDNKGETERYLEVGCGIAGKTLSFKSR